MSRKLAADALQEHLSHRVGHQLTQYARVLLQRHGMRLEKVKSKKLYFVHGGGSPPGRIYTDEELRGLLVQLRREEMKGR